MGKRRMFSTDVLYTDDFTSLPFSVRTLYVYLNLAADDDGFISSALQITRSCGASSEDFQMLLDTGYIMQISPKLYLVRHWRLQNQIRKDRYTPTIYQNELKNLLLINKIYYFPEEQPGIPDGYQAGYQTGPQISKDKNSLDKNSLVESNETKNLSRLSPTGLKIPTLEELKAYALKIDYPDFDAEKFLAYYEANGWTTAKGKPIKDWKAMVRVWKAREKDFNTNNTNKNGTKKQPGQMANQNVYDFEAIERDLLAN